MPDVTWTNTLVAPVTGSGIVLFSAYAAEGIVAGQPVAFNEEDGGDGLAYLGDNNHADTWRANIKGIAICDAATGQRVTVQQSGSIDYGSSVFTAGVPQFLSSNAGNICQAGDLGSGQTTTPLGVPSTTQILKLGIFNSEVRP